MTFSLPLLTRVGFRFLQRAFNCLFFKYFFLGASVTFDCGIYFSNYVTFVTTLISMC